MLVSNLLETRQKNSWLALNTVCSWLLFVDVLRINLSLAFSQKELPDFFRHWKVLVESLLLHIFLITEIRFSHLELAMFVSAVH